MGKAQSTRFFAIVLSFFGFFHCPQAKAEAVDPGFQSGRRAEPCCVHASLTASTHLDTSLEVSKWGPSTGTIPGDVLFVAPDITLSEISRIFHIASIAFFIRTGLSPPALIS